LSPPRLPTRQEYYTVREALAVLRIVKSSFYRLARQKGILFAKVGSRTVISRDELERLIQPGKELP
jgi:excisionase family DNA binding protein